MSSSPSPPAPRWRRFSLPRLVIIVMVVLGLPAIAYFAWPSHWRSGPVATPMTCVVERTEFIHDITEQGTVESGNNTEIRCEVKSNYTTGATILEIVPEGKMVEKDEILVKLDSSGLENDQIKQQMAVSNAKAELIKAETALLQTVHAKEEYLGMDERAAAAAKKEPAPNKPASEGTFVQQQKTLQSEVFVAQENLHRAEEYARYSERLAAKGYVTALQLEADRFAVDKAKKDLEVAAIKLKVLEGYTRKKTLTQLNSDIETAKARLKAQEDSYRLECNKLALIEDQIGKCIIRSPAPGQVVYANMTTSWGDKSVVIEAGTTVRERQVMIRMPDRDKMQVKARINESKIAQVAPGMAATIHLDALPDVELEGTVIKVEEYPAPTNRFSSSVKEYEATIRIHHSPPGLRPGLTAEAKIHVEHLPRALQVPVQAILEHGDQHYCVFHNGSDFETRPVRIGSTNDKFVVIREGLRPGEQVVLNPAAYRDQLTLPDLPRLEKRPEMLAEAAAAQPETRERRASGPAPKPVDESAARIRQFLTQYDKDSDGRVKLSDLPADVRAWAAKADANHDGSVDRAELQAAAPQLAARSSAGKSVPGTRP